MFNILLLFVSFFESSLFQAGDYEAAVIAYTEAITQNPKLHSYPLC